MSIAGMNRDTSRIPPLRVVIVGGGLAGMAAAVALESAGLDVALLEARSELGGRAGSFQDPHSTEHLDNCQHVLLGCCVNLIDFYQRIGALGLIRFDRTIHFRDAAGKRHDLWGLQGLQAPLHLGPSLLRFNALSGSERFALVRAMMEMIRLGRRGREALADVPFGDWLDAHAQPQSLVRKFYDPIVISGLNQQTRIASAAYAVQIFQEALLANSAGYVMGVPACPLGQLYASVPLKDARLGTRAGEFRIANDRVAAVVLQNGEQIPADAVVLATNYHALDRLVPQSWYERDARFARLDRLQSVPILGAHLWFDRPVMSEPHAAQMSGPLQWVFRKDRTGQAIHGVISAAGQWVDWPRQRMVELFEEQIRAMLPAAREARLVRSRIVIEKRATFSPAPGVDAIRPAQVPPPGGLRNLFLAGDYTRTAWPATMEGAVRSGYLAADAVIAALAPARRRGSFLVADLPIESAAKFLGMEE